MAYRDPNYQKKYYKKNREKYLKYFEEYYQKNKEKSINRNLKYYRENKEEGLKKRREYYQSHKKQFEEYYQIHKDQYLENENIRRKDPKYRLNQNISRAIRHSLKNGKNGLNWEKPVGYTLDDLVKHLERQFTPEMSWNNYGSIWEIDHIIPKSIFNFDNIGQLDFKRCWALSNLRPLEKYKNRQKHSRIDEFFQPSLKI